jgi:hypothetical protein
MILTELETPFKASLPTAEDWEIAEEITGPLPPKWKTLVSKVGTARFGDFVTLLSPNCLCRHGDIIQIHLLTGKLLVEFFEQTRKNSGEPPDIKNPVRIATTDNGDSLVVGEIKGKTSTIIINERDSDLEYFFSSPEELLEELVNGRECTKIFPEDVFLRPEVRFYEDEKAEGDKKYPPYFPKELQSLLEKTRRLTHSEKEKLRKIAPAKDPLPQIYNLQQAAAATELWRDQYFPETKKTLFPNPITLERSILLGQASFLSPILIDLKEKNKIVYLDDSEQEPKWKEIAKDLESLLKTLYEKP